MKAPIALLCILGAALTGWAQVDTATVTGIIRDSTGAVLPNVTVVATEMDTGIKTTSKSNAEGNYVITPLKIGRYSIAAGTTGFRTEKRDNIVLNVQQNLRLDFQLQVGSVVETTEVSGSAPLLDSESASLGNVIAAQQVE